MLLYGFASFWFKAVKDFSKMSRGKGVMLDTKVLVMQAEVHDAIPLGGCSRAIGMLDATIFSSDAEKLIGDAARAPHQKDRTSTLLVLSKVTSTMTGEVAQERIQLSSCMTLRKSILLMHLLQLMEKS